MDAPPALSLFRLFDPEWEDPYAFYRKLREGGPVQWDGWMRSWLVLGYPEIVALLRDERLSGARVDAIYDQLSGPARADLAPLRAVLSDMMLFNEPPRHTRLRQLIRPGLTPRFIRELRPVIADVADGLLDRVLTAGRMDLVHDFSEPLTREVIARLAGLDGAEARLLDDWHGLLHEFFTQSRAQLPRLARLREVFDRRSQRRRAGTADDLFSRLIADQLRRADYTADEVFGNFVLLIDAGQATTTHQLGNAMLALLRNPDQLRLLKEEPELIAGAVHELLRYDSAVQFTSRVAAADIEIGGRVIKRGQSVALVLGAGNRDPAQYPDPDRLDVRRRATDQLSFGHGIHYCLGAALSLAELEIAIDALLRRLDDLRLAEPEQTWLESINFRFLQRLPIEYTPAG